MDKSNEFRRNRHVVFHLHVHLVFVAKYRHDIFTEEIMSALKPIFAKVCGDFDSALIETNGEQDHVHLLVHYPPQVSISKLVNSLKGASSRLLRKNFPEVRKHYWRGTLWSPSYFAASCGGAPLDVVAEYIRTQAPPTD